MPKMNTTELSDGSHLRHRKNLLSTRIKALPAAAVGLLLLTSCGVQGTSLGLSGNNLPGMNGPGTAETAQQPATIPAPAEQPSGNGSTGEPQRGAGDSESPESENGSSEPPMSSAAEPDEGTGPSTPAIDAPAESVSTGAPAPTPSAKAAQEVLADLLARGDSASNGTDAAVEAGPGPAREVADATTPDSASSPPLAAKSATESGTATATPQQPTPSESASTANDPANLPGWGTPDLRSEFNYQDAQGNPAVDPAKWNVRSRSVLGLLNDSTVVDPGQVTVDENGIAHIVAEWLDEPISASTGPSERTMKTGYIDMRTLREGDASYAQQYGRWEIRAKVPTAAGTSHGTLPAFWLRNSDSGEIDIMEAWGSGPSPFDYQRIGTSTTTVHTNTMGFGNIKNAWTLEPLAGVTEHVANEFHTWALEYTPDRFAVIYDGELVVDTNPAETPEIWGPSFQSPLHVRLNLHVGPSEKYYGLPDPAHKSWTSDTDFQVDYVRIWDTQPE